MLGAGSLGVARIRGVVADDSSLSDDTASGLLISFSDDSFEEGTVVLNGIELPVRRPSSRKYVVATNSAPQGKFIVVKGIKFSKDAQASNYTRFHDFVIGAHNVKKGRNCQYIEISGISVTLELAPVLDLPRKKKGGDARRKKPYNGDVDEEEAVTSDEEVEMAYHQDAVGTVKLESARLGMIVYSCYVTDNEIRAEKVITTHPSGISLLGGIGGMTIPNSGNTLNRILKIDPTSGTKIRTLLKDAELEALHSTNTFFGLPKRDAEGGDQWSLGPYMINVMNVSIEDAITIFDKLEGTAAYAEARTYEGLMTGRWIGSNAGHYYIIGEDEDAGGVDVRYALYRLAEALNTIDGNPCAIGLDKDGDVIYGSAFSFFPNTSIPRKFVSRNVISALAPTPLTINHKQAVYNNTAFEEGIITQSNLSAASSDLPSYVCAISGTAVKSNKGQISFGTYRLDVTDIAQKLSEKAIQLALSGVSTRGVFTMLPFCALIADKSGRVVITQRIRNASYSSSRTFNRQTLGRDDPLIGVRRTTETRGNFRGAAEFVEEAFA